MAKKKKQIPTSRRKRAHLRATSPRGLTHQFDDLHAFDQQTIEYEDRRRVKEKKDLAESKRFWKWLLSQPKPTFGPEIVWTDKLFRAVWKTVPVLSIAGSRGCGGRFNLGAAQATAHFKIQEAGCLYVASSIQCCRAEMQPPHGPTDEYEILPKKELKLWDLRKVLGHLNDPVLTSRVEDAPLDAIWKLQKIPLTPQLLAQFLRSIGGDGIIFPSTKDPTGQNIALFFDSDDEVKAALEALLLK